MHERRCGSELRPGRGQPAATKHWGARLSRRWLATPPAKASAGRAWPPSRGCLSSRRATRGMPGSRGNGRRSAPADRRPACRPPRRQAIHCIVRMSYGCRQKRPQLEPGFVNLRFRCALADAEDGGDFVVLKPLHVVEDERRARAFGQPRNSPLEIQPLDSAISAPPWVRASSPRRASSWPRAPWSGDSSGDRDTCSSPGDTARFPLRSRREIPGAFDRASRKISCNRSSASARVPHIRHARLNNRVECCR